MNAHEALKFTINAGAKITAGYIGDLTDQELFHRPAPEANHINWQFGHLINAEHQIATKYAGGAMPPLPAGFSERYGMDKTNVDDPAAFCTKDELLAIHQEQRAGSLAALDAISEADLSKPSGWEFAPTLGEAMGVAAGTHWWMHLGQWAIVRRQLGRKPLF